MVALSVVVVLVRIVDVAMGDLKSMADRMIGRHERMIAND
jgi:hypothetical protein